jgi:hypothetical protein
LEESSNPEPAKPAGPSSAGFAGSNIGSLSKIEDASETQTPIETATSASAPEPQKLGEYHTPKPAKPAKPGFAGFAGSTLERPSMVPEMDDWEPTDQIEVPVQPEPSKPTKTLADVDPEERSVLCAEWKAGEERVPPRHEDYLEGLKALHYPDDYPD